MEIFPINIFPWLMAAGTYKHKAVSRMWSVSHLLQTDVSLAGRFYNWWPHCPVHSGLRGGVDMNLKSCVDFATVHV